MIFFVIHNSRVNIFGFWAVDWTKQDILQDISPCTVGNCNSFFHFFSITSQGNNEQIHQ